MYDLEHARNLVNDAIPAASPVKREALAKQVYQEVLRTCEGPERILLQIRFGG